MHRISWAFALSSIWLAGVGCSDRSPCPLGQVRVGGECTDLVGDASAICGAGTYYNPHEAACVADPAEVCGPATEVEWVLDEDGLPTGTFICRGTGDVVEPPECPDAEPGGNICINGFLKYLMDPDDPTRFMQTPAVFDEPTLMVRIYDPIQYALGQKTPLGENTVVVAQDGTFKVENIPVPAAGFVAVAVDDDETTGRDDFAFMGYAYKATAGTNLLRVDAFVVTTAQNQQWTDAIGQSAVDGAGCPAGSTLMDCGTWIGIFGYQKEDGSLVTIEGVVPEYGGAAIAGNKTFYLNDDYESFTPGPASTTSTGVVFYPTAGLGQYRGSCAAGTPCETEGYSWPATGTTGGAAAGALFVQIVRPTGYE